MSDTATRTSHHDMTLANRLTRGSSRDSSTVQKSVAVTDAMQDIVYEETNPHHTYDYVDPDICLQHGKFTTTQALTGNYCIILPILLVLHLWDQPLAYKVRTTVPWPQITLNRVQFCQCCQPRVGKLRQKAATAGQKEMIGSMVWNLVYFPAKNQT